MTYSISKLFQIAISTLAIVPLSLSFNLPSARAEPPLKPITEIAGNPLQIDSGEESPTDDTNTETSGDREKSMEYLKSGYNAEQDKNKEEALENYSNAIKVDRTNGWAFLLAGRLIGPNETGIKLVKTAYQLFTEQDDREGAEMALELLKTANADN